MTRNPFSVGTPGNAPWNVRRGSHPGSMITGPTPGRADKVPVGVRNGSFVIPADAVSALGEDNSESGAEILARMFKTEPAADEGGEQVGIAASHVEFIVSPQAVAEIGHGTSGCCNGECQCVKGEASWVDGRTCRG